MSTRRAATGAAALLLVSLAACGSDGSSAGATDPTTPTTPTTPTASSTPQLITYESDNGDPGVQVESLGDAAALEGAPADFADFIGRVAQDLADSTTCTGGYVGVTVSVVRTDGFARGGVNDCGGYAALWAQVDGVWQEIDGTQEMWDCAVLERYGVPSDIAGTDCWDSEADKRRTYQHA